jgi:two-component system, sensor histidine kinase and response regulator
LKSLIVEDHDDTRDMLAAVLKSRGHSVSAHCDAESALHSMQGSRIDLILLDLSLPKMDGLSFCKAVRAMPACADAVIVMCTGRGQTEDLNAALEAGADDYLVKPLNPDELATRIVIAENRVKHRAARRENELKLHALSAQLVVAEEQERRRLAGQLHDGIGQNLGWVKIQLSALKARTQEPESVTTLIDITKTLDTVIQQTRSLTFEISPPILYEMGLEPALEWLTEHFQSRFGLPCSFEFTGSASRLSSDVAVVLFQAVRELLFNVVKHAKAKHATVAVQRDAAWIMIAVSDDGIGIDLATSTRPIEKLSGFGIFSIRERLTYLGGALEVDSGRGKGTRIVLKAPFQATQRLATVRPTDIKMPEKSK